MLHDSSLLGKTDGNHLKKRIWFNIKADLGFNPQAYLTVLKI
jgi:hypothetical protein